jgi:hypothetical protein
MYPALILLDRLVIFCGALCKVVAFQRGGRLYPGIRKPPNRSEYLSRKSVILSVRSCKFRAFQGRSP